MEQEIGPQVFQNQSVARILQKQGGGISGRAKKAPEPGKPSGVSAFLIVLPAL
jgi:hypothetical protein